MRTGEGDLTLCHPYLITPCVPFGDLFAKCPRESGQGTEEKNDSHPLDIFFNVVAFGTSHKKEAIVRF